MRRLFQFSSWQQSQRNNKALTADILEQFLKDLHLIWSSTYLIHETSRSSSMVWIRGSQPHHITLSSSVVQDCRSTTRRLFILLRMFRVFFRNIFFSVEKSSWETRSTQIFILITNYIPNKRIHMSWSNNGSWKSKRWISFRLCHCAAAWLHWCLHPCPEWEEINAWWDLEFDPVKQAIRCCWFYCHVYFCFYSLLWSGFKFTYFHFISESESESKWFIVIKHEEWRN